MIGLVQRSVDPELSWLGAFGWVLLILVCLAVVWTLTLPSVWREFLRRGRHKGAG